MLNKAKGFALLSALLIAIGVLTGCSASVGTTDNGAKLESIIKKQFAGKVADRVKNPAVDSVTCKKGSAGTYDCVAKVSYDTAKGKRVTAPVAIQGSCDSKKCRWETK